MYSTKVTGLDELLRDMDAVADAPKINVSCQPIGWHTGEETKKGGQQPPRPNAMIFAAQAKQDRDPSFLESGDEQRGMALVVDMANAWTARDPRAIMDAASKLGDLFTATVKRHIEEGRSDGGKPMRPLTKVYEEIKKWKYHAAGKPILVRTGELLRSIQPKISVRGGRR